MPRVPGRLVVVWYSTQVAACARPRRPASSVFLNICLDRFLKRRMRKYACELWEKWYWPCGLAKSRRPLGRESSIVSLAGPGGFAKSGRPPGDKQNLGEFLCQARWACEVKAPTWLKSAALGPTICQAFSLRRHLSARRRPTGEQSESDLVPF